jgi:hypothetical protein
MRHLHQPVGTSRLGRPILLAPLIFVAHFAEEAPGFVAWFNAHVPRGITQDLFWTVNVVALAVTIVVVAMEWLAASAFTAAAVVAWFSFLVGANALLHVVGALADRAYVPGLVTAAVLYVPFYGWVVGQIVRARRLPLGWVAVIAILGALPMLVHGYLIVFRQSRLF